jgi:phosphoserine phosphatase
VVLVRHGETNSNTLGIVQGRGSLDNPEKQSYLTEKGQKQAAAAGQALADLPLQAVYVSPLERAKHTAQLILGARSASPTPVLHPNLLEINLTPWDGIQFDDIAVQFPEQYQNWQNAPEKLFVGDRYPVLELFAQAEAFWSEILPKHQGQTVLVVAHSGINRCLLATAMGIAPHQYHQLQQANCGISVLNFTGTTLADGVQMESINLTSHLAEISGSVLPSKRKPNQGPRLLLVRHGETEWNRQKRFQGQIDVPLNPQGEAQAAKAGAFLASVTIDRAFSSPMLRPKDTALAILSHHSDIEIQYYDDLKEISHGLWEGKYEPEIRKDFPGELEKWQAHPETVQMPEGENLQQVWDRVAVTWQEIVESVPAGETALVVAHDAVNKAILCLLFGLGPDKFWTFKQGNGAVSVIDYPRGADQPPVLQSMNITTHLASGVLDKTAAGAL